MITKCFPKRVECLALLLLFTNLALADDSSTMRTLFNFTDEPPTPAWKPNNDGVMGGISTGSAQLAPDGMVFSGKLSLENNGGFSSVYSLVDYDLSDFDGIRMKVYGDGRTYQLRFESDARYRDREPVTFSGEFETTASEWTEVFVPFSELKQSWRGRELSGNVFNREEISRIAIMLADNQPGTFELTVSTIAAHP